MMSKKISPNFFFPPSKSYSVDVSKYYDNNRCIYYDDMNKDEQKILPDKYFKIDKYFPENLILKSLPKFLHQHQFLNDCRSMFEYSSGDDISVNESEFRTIYEKKKEEIPLEPNGNLNKEQILSDLYENFNKPLNLKQNNAYRNLLEIDQIDAEKIHKFFTIFPKLPLFFDIARSANGYSEKAAIYLVMILKFIEKQDGDATFSTNIMKITKQLKFGIPLLGEVNIGKLAGSGMLELKKLEQCYEIQEILDEIRNKFSYIAVAKSNLISTFYPSDDTQPRYILNFHESLLLTEFLYPDDIFFRKIAFKELLTFQHYKYDDRPKTYVMLIDVSGSMAGRSINYAYAAAIAMVENIHIGSHKGYILLFDSGICATIECKSVKMVIEELLSTPFSGGGTNINNALQEADSLKPEEIILITDGFDSVSYKPKAPLYTIFCSDEANATLERISTKYEEYA